MSDEIKDKEGKVKQKFVIDSSNIGTDDHSVEDDSDTLCKWDGVYDSLPKNQPKGVSGVAGKVVMVSDAPTPLALNEKESSDSTEEVELKVDVCEEKAPVCSSTECRTPDASTNSNDEATEGLKDKGTETVLKKEDPNQLSMLIKECFDLQGMMGDSKSKVVAASEAVGVPFLGGLMIGGDIAHICKTAAEMISGPSLPLTMSEKELRAQGRKNLTPKVKVVAKAKEHSTRVAVASDSVERKCDGRRLPTTPSSSRTKTSGGPDALGNFVKKLPLSSPVPGKVSPFPTSSTPSPGRVSGEKSLGSGASPTLRKSGSLALRSQTARGRLTLSDSPLPTDLDLPELKTKRISTDFTRLLKPTRSSSAKIALTTGTGQSSPTKVTHSNYSVTKSTPSPMMGDADAGNSGEASSPAPSGGNGDTGNASLKEQFGVFSRFGDSASDGKQITLSNCDKWMKQAHVIDGKKLTTTDTSITFKKLFKTTKRVGFDDFKRYVEDLAKNKGIDGSEILEKLSTCGTPGLSQATKAAHANVVSRLTDTSKYTGSHKERFDAKGKGRGMEGRKDLKNTTGYVAAFKDKHESSPSPTPK